MRVLIVGSGRPAYFLARRFVSGGHAVTLVVSEDAEARRLARMLDGVPVVLGDGARPEVLDDAGALNADAIVALTSEDHRNLAACQIARRVFSVGRTIALVNDPENQDVFRRLGVDAAVSITQLLAGLLAQETIFEEIRRFEAFAGGQILVTDLELPATAPATGKRLSEIGAASGLVAAVLRDGQSLVPWGDTRLEGGDRLVVITTPDAHDHFLRLLLGRRP